MYVKVLSLVQQFTDAVEQKTVPQEEPQFWVLHSIVLKFWYGKLKITDKCFEYQQTPQKLFF